MKKLILSLTISAFVVAAHAGDACSAEKSACPAAAEQTKAPSCCPASGAEMTKATTETKATASTKAAKKQEVTKKSKQIKEQKMAAKFDDTLVKK